MLAADAGGAIFMAVLLAHLPPIRQAGRAKIHGVIIGLVEDIEPGQRQRLGGLRWGFQVEGFLDWQVLIGDGAFQVPHQHVSRIQRGLHPGENHLRTLRQHLLPHGTPQHDVPNRFERNLRDWGRGTDWGGRRQGGRGQGRKG